MPIDRFDVLGDDTRIQTQSWSELKVIAMSPGFKRTESYTTLSKEDQDLLDRLILAQYAQGDMSELKYNLSEEQLIDEANQQYSLKEMGTL